MLYTPNRKLPFVLLGITVFCLVLLLIPLRPSNWGKNSAEQQAAPKDKIAIDTFVNTVFKIDSIEIKVSEDSSYIQIDSILVQDTIVGAAIPAEIIAAQDTATPVAPIVNSNENIANNNDSGFLFSLLKLLLFLFFLFGLAFFYSKKKKQKYWLKYSANLDSIDTKPWANNLDFGNFDFETSNKTAPKDNLDAIDTKLDFEDTESIVDNTASTTSSKSITNQDQLEAIATTTISSNTIVAPLAKSSFFDSFLWEVLSRPFKIVKGFFRGIWFIVSYFFRDSSQDSSIDFKWHDFVSILLLSLFIPFWNVFLAPLGYSFLIFAILPILWITPSIIRRHWGWATFAIVLFLAEGTALLVHLILELTKNAPPSKGNNNTFYWIVGIAVAIYLWSKRTSIKNILTINKKEKPKPTTIVPTTDFRDNSAIVNQTPLASSKENVVETPIILYFDMESQIPYWWKKIDLGALNGVAMPSHNLDENSAFVTDYLPECITAKFIYFNNNKFKEIPYELTALDQLEVLDMSNNHIRDLLVDLKYCTNLKTLKLNNNYIQHIPSDVSNLKKLQVLELCNNPIQPSTLLKLKQRLPNTQIIVDKTPTVAEKPIIEEKEEKKEDVHLLDKLKELLADELKNPNEVTEITLLADQELVEFPPSFLLQFPNLKRLDLSGNLFESIPIDIFQLTQLQYLSLFDNKITAVADEIGNLTNLETLELDYNKLETISPNLAKLKKLRSLAISHTHIQKIPTVILELSQLTSLDISSNPIQNLPDSFTLLVELKSLNLSFTHLGKIPPVVFQLPTLEDLNYSSNNLKELPIEITNLPKLTRLNISFNADIKVPAGLLEQLSQLQHLFCSGILNNRSTFPFRIDQLQQLKSLSIGYNNLVHIPREVFQLTNLSNLYLAGNDLRYLNDEIGKLTNLQSISFAQNKNLERLSAAFYQLKKLHTIYLQDTKIPANVKKKVKTTFPNRFVYF